ncbi:MAG: hypothetical protein SOU27_04490 [Sodaliphilus sp.]|nr:hypothetical protein [Sodaliphilus sp.]
MKLTLATPRAAVTPAAPLLRDCRCWLAHVGVSGKKRVAKERPA